MSTVLLGEDTNWEYMDPRKQKKKKKKRMEKLTQ